MSFICADSRRNAKRGDSCPYLADCLFRGFFSIMQPRKTAGDTTEHNRLRQSPALPVFIRAFPGVSTLLF
jgi:hypothetical protein